MALVVAGAAAVLAVVAAVVAAVLELLELELPQPVAKPPATISVDAAAANTPSLFIRTSDCVALSQPLAIYYSSRQNELIFE